ncbi:condensation domain-containing protein [Burkholderia sp. LMG 21824]|uniref:condensation domain-containing protein n=1 Tax=Burkholderia sp. LMG 21824 TaxID=3158172 RepID=UPI003C2D044C
MTTLSMAVTSLSQDRFLFNQALNKEDWSYNIPMVMTLEGPLDGEGLEWSLNEVVRRHEVLRTGFSMNEEGEPVAAIRSDISLALPLVDLSGLPEEEAQTEAERLVKEDARRPFDLSDAPLMRVLLVRVNETKHIFFVNVHHIVFDGWSGNIFVRELGELYRSRKEACEPELADLPIQYRDFAQWQRDWLEGEELERQLSYWRKQLADAPQTLQLPCDYERPAKSGHHGATQVFELPVEYVGKISELAKRYRATPFMVMFAVFNVLMYRYTGAPDICVGTPIANRNREEVEGLIGLFINTLVLRTKLSGDMTFAQVLEEVRTTTLDAYSNQDLPFDRLVRGLNLTRKSGQSPLVNTMFGYHLTADRALRLPGLRAMTTFLHSDVARFDLIMNVFASDATLTGYVEYRTELFKASTIQSMVVHFKELICRICLSTGTKLPILRLVDSNFSVTYSD